MRVCRREREREREEERKREIYKGKERKKENV